MPAFTDLHRVTLHGTVTRQDGQPAEGTVLVSVNGPTQDQAAGELIVEQPDTLELVDGGFVVSVPARDQPPAPLLEIQVRLTDTRTPALFQFEVVTTGADATWEVTV